jgi:CRP-like cAMP-binding protein
VLGEMALFLETNERMATAIATKDSILITILSFSVLELSKKNPQLLEKIRAIIDNRVARNNAKEKNDF